jgi:nucleoside-diphosphate-sugar epimerase
VKVAILGANGQVGAEVCLILRNFKNISLVPVCRNRLGSAFLRYQGIPCRHGLATDNNQAVRLISDCPVVANFALGSGSLREASDVNRHLIRNSIEYSPPNATILYFSTVTVYGDPSTHAWIRWKNAYAREKLRCERLALRLGRKYGNRVYVLRLGHVCGELQGITQIIRQDIANGPVSLPAPARKSNLVHMATIVDAILKAVSGELGEPGVYDLLNSPQWTWREVYEYEARRTGQPLELDPSNCENKAAGLSLGKRIISRLVGVILGNPARKEYAMQLIARLSVRLNKRIQAMYYVNRAGSEINALENRTIVNDALYWREVGWKTLSGLGDTKELLARQEYHVQNIEPSVRWPADLELAQK